MYNALGICDLRPHVVAEASETTLMNPALKPLLVFFPLAFLFSWYSFVLFHMGVPRATGGINPLGPAVAALITAAVFDRGRGVKELLGRYLRWRIGWSPYVFALLAPVAINTAAAVLNVLFGAPVPGRAQLAAWPQVFPAFVFVFLFIGLGEETGWRGYALPQLQRLYSPVPASLILGVIWAVWHVPLMGKEFAPPVVPFFVMSVLAGSVVAAWLFNRSAGSLLPQPAFHAAVNSFGAGYLFPMFTGPDLIHLWWIYTALWVGLAVALAVGSRAMRAQGKAAGAAGA